MNLSAVAKANLEFSFKLWKKLAEENVDENIFFSPFSVSTSLAMVHLGARGITEKQIGDVLGISDMPDAYKQLADLSTTVKTKSEGCSMISASRLFAGKDYSFLDDFLWNTKSYFGSEAENMDFRANLEGTRQSINSWVASQTKDKIKDFLSEGSINIDTVMVLINAIYFKGDWLIAFDPKHTFNDTFYVNQDEKISVEMMFMSKRLRIGFDSQYRIHLVELPYKGKELSMIVMLPARTGEHLKFEREINKDILDSMVDSLVEEKVELYLPKFKVSFEQKLISLLKSMGIVNAFEIGTADFSGMNGKKDLFVSEMLQKSFIEVNEVGTEAAAATGVAFETMDLPPQIRCCHPFVYAIRHNSSGSILFIGRMNRPSY